MPEPTSVTGKSVVGTGPAKAGTASGTEAAGAGTAYGQFLGLAKSSRSYRRFDESRPVSREQLLMLVEAARFAPCARNAQELRFHVVADADERARVFRHLRWAAALKDWNGPEPGERPGGYVVILAPEPSVKTALHGYDAGMAAQTILLAARTLGLGGCVVKSFDQGLLAELRVADPGLDASLVLALGVPAEQVVLEPADTPHGLAYWREPDGSHHVPKLSLEELLA